MKLMGYEPITINNFAEYKAAKEEKERLDKAISRDFFGIEMENTPDEIRFYQLMGGTMEYEKNRHCEVYRKDNHEVVEMFTTAEEARNYIRETGDENLSWEWDY